MFELNNRHLYLCVPLRDDMSTFLPEVLRGGVDIVQLREKDRPVADQRSQATEMLAICRDFGVPFIINDSPEFAADVHADGVHVGQDDVSVEHCRELVGSDAIVGLSTHSSDEFENALATTSSYFSAGPIVATPTKPGREGTGIEYAINSQATSSRPVFVTGGVNATNVAGLVNEGLRHFVVVRALTESSAPETDARALRAALDDALAMTI